MKRKPFNYNLHPDSSMLKKIAKEMDITTEDARFIYLSVAEIISNDIIKKGKFSTKHIDITAKVENPDFVETGERPRLIMETTFDREWSRAMMILRARQLRKEAIANKSDNQDVWHGRIVLDNVEGKVK